VSNVDPKADVACGDHEDAPPLSSSSQTGHLIKWKRAKRHTTLLREAGCLLLGLVVAARDSGPGIHPAHLERIFESFYTTKPHGTGMGLSICRSITDAHGGRLWAEANEPRGTIFQFTLPALQVGP